MPLKAVFLDCDGTLTTVKSSWEYLHRRLGLWDDHADEFQRLFREGAIDYYEFCRRDALLWKGMPLASVMAVIDEIPYHEGARELADWLASEGILSIILSTGLSFLVERVRKELGITRALSNELLVRDGILTGEIAIHIDYDQKGFQVQEMLERMGMTRDEAAAIGDGEGDKGMFESVDLSIGYHPHAGVLHALDYAVYNDSLSGVVTILRRHR
jgi:phosphoserine phosphatase